MTHFLFPDHKPPMLAAPCDVRTVCIWLLAVMDRDDKGVKFVSSILNYYMVRGYLTQKQMDVLSSVWGRINNKMRDGELQCQGMRHAKIKPAEAGNVVRFKRIADDDVQVIE